VRSDIEVFIEHHWGPDPSNLDQLYSQSATNALVSCHHLSMFCTVILSLTYISVVFCQNKYGKEMMRLYGEGVNRREQEIDYVALYASREGKSHEQWVDGYCDTARAVRGPPPRLGRAARPWPHDCFGQPRMTGHHAPWAVASGRFSVQYCARGFKCFSIVLNFRNCFKLQKSVETCRSV
jgi:hypothetical protein